MINKKRGIFLILILSVLLSIITFLPSVPAPIEECDNDGDCGSGYDCIGGACIQQPQDECSVDSDCPQGTVCQRGDCAYGTDGYKECSLVPISGCCTYDSQCNDGNLCTTDSCTDNTCVNTPKWCPNGCNPATGSCYPTLGDCISCTEDQQCTSGACRETPSSIAQGLNQKICAPTGKCPVGMDTKGCIAWDIGDYFCSPGTPAHQFICGLDRAWDMSSCTSGCDITGSNCAVAEDEIYVFNPEDLIGNYILIQDGTSGINYDIYSQGYCEIIQGCTGYRDTIAIDSNLDLSTACRCDETWGCSGESCITNVFWSSFWARIESVVCTGCGGLNDCETGCINDDDCASGLNCKEDNEGINRCVNFASDSCLFYHTKTGCMEVTDDNSICFDSNNTGYCNAGYWEENFCGIEMCNDTTGDCIISNPHIIWESTTGSTITNVNLIDSTPLATVKIRFVDYTYTGLEGIDFTIMESDSALSDNLGTITGTYDGKDLVATWQITQQNLEDSIHPLENDFENDNIFEFYVTLSTYKTTNLLATKTFSTCGDGFQNYGEEGIDCGEVCGNTCQPATCFDGQQNNDETSVDCGGSCDACIKEVLWTSAEVNYSEYNDSVIRYLTVEDIINKNVKFRMVSQPVTAENEEFVLKEDDTIGDDTIQDNLFGAYDVNGNLVYLWTPEISDFWAAGLTETTYGFYFEVDGKTSTNLLIELDSELPTCDDEIMNGDEVDVDCGGSCPNQDCVSVCFSKNVCNDYQLEGNCNADICNIAENSVPDLEADETASCIWNLNICNTKKTLYYNGTEIGSCIYVEDTTTDNCDDGFLSYSWTASMDWGTNVYANEALCGLNCVFDQGTWHYDPLAYGESCIAGSQTIPCPAQIQLNFFTWKNFFATALLILIIYIILKNSKTFKKTQKKIVTKKNVSNKKIASKKKVTKKKKIVKKK
jgi:hypothetical protein